MHIKGFIPFVPTGFEILNLEVFFTIEITEIAKNMGFEHESATQVGYIVKTETLHHEKALEETVCTCVPTGFKILSFKVLSTT